MPKCFGDVTLPVTVTVQPEVKARFEIDKTSGCAPMKIIIKNTTTGVSLGNCKFLWFFENDSSVIQTTSLASFSHEYTNKSDSSVTYHPKLVVRPLAGCGSTMQSSVVVNPEINAQFTKTKTEGCNPLSVQFTNETKGYGNGYKWEFNNAATDTSKNPQYIFTNPTIRDSVFNVKLIATSKYACKDTAIYPVKVFSNISAGFAVNKRSGFSPLDIIFTNTSKGATKQTWFFGDGETSDVQNPTHTFLNATDSSRKFSIVLTSINNYNCSDTSKLLIRVDPKCTASFISSTSIGLSPLLINFTNTSTNINSQIWNFGESSTSIEINSIHTFINNRSTPIKFSVKLKVNNQYGSSDSITKDISVLPNCKSIAQFEVNTDIGHSPLNINFTNKSDNAESYKWLCGDSTLSTSVNLTKTFTNNGTTNLIYTIKLVASHTYCKSDTFTHNITLLPKCAYSGNKRTVIPGIGGQ